MKNGSIISLFRKHEAKGKTIASSAPPIPDVDEFVPPIPVLDEELCLPPIVEDEEQPLPSLSVENKVPNEEEEEEEAEEVEDSTSVYDVDCLEHDPGLRVPISNFDVNDQDATRRGYILKGPCHLYAHEYPVREIYALFGFLSTLGLNIVWRRMQHFVSLAICLAMKLEHGSRMVGVIGIWLRFILHQGLASRGHDESEESTNKGNFLELLQWLAGTNEEVSKVVLKNAPSNCILTSPLIQKQIIRCCSMETTRHIVEELGEDYFAILADESSDSLIANHHLTLTQIRGQGYDGASNMKGEIKGLKTLIMKESPSAYYVHCFAHQLQLVLVAVAKGDVGCQTCFGQVSRLLNIVGISCKRHDMLRDVRARKLKKALQLGEIEGGTGLNQEMGLARPSDTRWSSHYKTILHIIHMYSTIMENYIDDVRGDDRFDGLNTLGELSIKLVQTQKHDLHDMVFLLLKLVLILLVATASVERVFSAMRLVKNHLRNHMGDQLLNDCLVTFTEREIFSNVSEDDIVDLFMAMKKRKRKAGYAGVPDRSKYAQQDTVKRDPGPSTTVKLERRMEGSGSACSSLLVCTSLYTEARHPGAGPPFAAAAQPLDVATAAAMRAVWFQESGVRLSDPVPPLPPRRYRARGHEEWRDREHKDD
ncbi:hypothetical protein U9M48_040254 [Paspalum notatum var. saurae]|uniref:Uncharacterized protein n=1 Tax=Paspalum notatum var. saurae TaxID=547442 RepID=A0AAQ3UME7_PASNO